ncbi:MAG: isoprenylcysteine carboxylmethyltransferase family protein [Bacteroidales bacterium]|nr:MAG: isoprenylcysteine carboxylmethyltransferase family protein [Bacteroidales bacterium]
MQVHYSLIFHLPEAIVFWIVFIWVFIPEVRLIRRTVRAPKSPQDASTINTIRYWGQLAFFSSFVVSFFPWLLLPWQFTFFVFGTCFLIVGGILRRVCFRTLGEYFTGAIIVKKDQTVIDKGPYRWVRHPSYTAGFIVDLGVGFALGSWISVLFLFAMPCFIYARRVRAEEKALLETIGEPYRVYMARTKRFIPFVV